MKFIVSAKVFRWPSGNWHFVYVDEKNSKKIKASKGKRVGFGFVPVRCKLGQSEWQTTFFPTKKGPYLLSVNAKVRKAEGIYDGDLVSVRCELI